MRGSENEGVTTTGNMHGIVECTNFRKTLNALVPEDTNATYAGICTAASVLIAPPWSPPDTTNLSQPQNHLKTQQISPLQIDCSDTYMAALLIGLLSRAGTRKGA